MANPTDPTAERPPRVVDMTRSEMASLHEKARKRGQWSKEHKHIGKTLNHAMRALDTLRDSGFISDAERGRVSRRIVVLACRVGFLITQRTDGRHFVFIPAPRKKVDDGQ